MADADAQAPEVFRTKAGSDVLQSVMAAQSPIQLQLGAAWRQIQLIMNHKNLFGWNLVKLAQCAHGSSAGVHVGLRTQQPKLRVILPNMRA